MHHMVPPQPQYTIPLPSPLPGIPAFDGGDPLREGTTADQLILHLEAMRQLLPPMTDGQWILMTATRFKKGGYAWHWWQSILAAANGVFPYTNWQNFKLAFVNAMRGPDPATAVRLELSGLKMSGNDLNGYVAKFRALHLRLHTLGKPMAEADAVHKFAVGLTPRLRQHCPLEDHVSLTDAIAKVTKKYHSRELYNLFPGEGSSRRSVRRDAEMHALPAHYGYDDEDPEAEYDDWDDGLGEEFEELAVADGGRGRGRGRRPGSGGRGRLPARGRGERGRRGGRGRDRGRGRAQLNAQQRVWFAAGQCLHCGSADHWASDCPQKPADRENV